MVIDMGNYNCTTSSPSGYSRLPTYSYDPSSSLRKPLLGNFTQRVEQQQEELLNQIEVNRGNMPRLKAANQNIQTTISNSDPPPSKALPTKDQKQPDCMDLHNSLEKELQELRHRVTKLETSCPSCFKQGRAVEKLKKNNAVLEKKVLELTATIDDMKKRTAPVCNISSLIAVAAVGSKPEKEIPDLIDMESPVPSTDHEPSFINEIISGGGILSPEIDQVKNNPIISKTTSNMAFQEINHANGVNDLIGCIMVLIFLVSMLIGLLL